jgi:molybdopterin converting factor small subunit
MRIRIKMMGALRTKLPAGFPGNTAPLDLDTGATTSTLLQKLGLSTGQIHLVMVNGEMDHDKNRKLNEGDEVTLFPPVAGGSLFFSPRGHPAKAGNWRRAKMEKKKWKRTRFPAPMPAW